MTAQEFIADETQRAMDGFLYQAKKIPVDKLTWNPGTDARNVLDMIAECAVMSSYYPSILGALEAPEFNDEMLKRYFAAKAEYKTFEQAEADLKAGTAKTIEAIRAIPDDQMSKKIMYFGPEPWTIASVANAHVWNMHWHTGQICYIQTLLGDKSF